MGNGYTCVARQYRGHGFARALKARTVEWCRKHGVRYIYTENDFNNKRMLAINISLGYKPIPGSIEFVKTL